MPPAELAVQKGVVGGTEKHATHAKAPRALERRAACQIRAFARMESFGRTEIMRINCWSKFGRKGQPPFRGANIHGPDGQREAIKRVASLIRETLDLKPNDIRVIPREFRRSRRTEPKLKQGVSLRRTT